MATIIWMNSNENKLRNQALKNQFVLSNVKDKKAKGEMKIKTLIRM